MVYKILVIDDKGDLSELMSDLFQNDSDIKIKSSKSNLDDLKKSFDRFAYLIIINEDELKLNLNDLIKFIRDSLFYLTIPVIILSSDADLVSSNKKVFDLPIYNYLVKPINPEIFKKFVKYLSEVCDYNKNINDISGLPGNRIIDYRVKKEIERGSNFSMVYLDLDNFKEFVEYNGLYEGSEVILYFSNLLSDTIKTYGSIYDFIGHIGGDDFVAVITDCEKSKMICDEIIKEFDKKILEYYSPEDLEKGYIEVINRAGEEDKINIMGISIIIMNYTEFKDASYDEVYKKMMKIKRKAKMHKGSVVMS